MGKHSEKVYYLAYKLVKAFRYLAHGKMARYLRTYLAFQIRINYMPKSTLVIYKMTWKHQRHTATTYLIEATTYYLDKSC